MKYENLATSILIEKCVEKDPTAWAEFVKRFSPLVALSVKKAFLKYAACAPRAREEIKDIQQDIMTSFWENNKLEEIRNREKINYWLAITARNATVNYLKTNRKEVLISDESYFEKIPAKEINETRDSAKEIKKIYASLSPKEKIIFRLYFKKELGLKDISKILAVPLGSVSSVIARMRKKIKK